VNEIQKVMEDSRRRDKEVLTRDRESWNRMTEMLNPDERAELDALRAEKNAGPVTAAAPEQTPLPDTHWLHLGNGDVVTSKGVASHVDGIPVIHAVEIPVVDTTPAHRF
jgi:hypothetical protein